MGSFFKLAVLAAVVMGLAVVGCAGAPPREDLARAETSVESARRAGATADSPVELRRAQEKLDAARAAIKDKEYEKAERLAKEASVDADLAQQKAITARSQKSLAEVRQSINLLRQEIGLPPES